MSMKRMVMAVAVAAAAFGARAAGDIVPTYALGVPPVTPIRITTDVNTNAWLASNAVHVAMSSCFTDGADAISMVDQGRTGVTDRYRLVSAEAGFPWERLKPEYYLTDRIRPPENVDWQATYEKFMSDYEGDTGDRSGFLFNYDDVDPCVYAANGGTHVIDWVLKDGTVKSETYVIGAVTQGRPKRIYWTDPPYNSPKISLQGKFVRFFGAAALTTPRTATVTNFTGGIEVEQKGIVVEGLYLDKDSMVLEARGKLTGQVLMAYYDSGNYDSILCVQALEICQPDVIVQQAAIGSMLKPDGRGYDVEGLTARVTAGIGVMTDDRGDYLYQHAGQHSYSPKNKSVFAIRPTYGERWKAEIYWMETDPMDVQWPFEVDQYELTWPADIQRFVRGDLPGDYGAPIRIPTDLTAELQKWQEPDGHARDVGTDGEFMTVGAGKALLKLTGDDNVWFLPIESILRGDTGVYDQEGRVERINVGEELTVRGGSASGVAKDARPFAADAAVPGYIYQAGTPNGNYDVNLYSETNTASSVYAVSPDGDIEVWWSETWKPADLPVTITVPVLPQVYRPVWPKTADAPQIVIASQQGSANETVFAHDGAACFEATNATMALPGRSYFPQGEGTVMFWTRSDRCTAEAPPAATNAPGRLLTLDGGSVGKIVAEIVAGNSAPLLRAYVGNAVAEAPLPEHEAPDTWHHVAITFGKDGSTLDLDGTRTGFTGGARAALEQLTDYFPVEYIESTRLVGQYIDTGYKPNQNTHVVMDVDVHGGKEYWFAVWDKQWNEGAFGLCNDGDDQGIYYAVGDDGGSFHATNTTNGCVSNGRRTVEITPYSFLVDGEIWKEKERMGDFQLKNNLYIFAQNRQGSAFVARSWLNGIRCYGCKIFESDVPQRDFVPCVRVADGAAGFYDTVNAKFYGNAGAGAFVSPGCVAPFASCSLGAYGFYLTAAGREMAEVTFFNRCLASNEVAEAKHAIRTGEEIDVTGYFSFRAGEDLVATVQKPDDFAFAFRDRVGGGTCRAVNTVLARPGAPMRGSAVVSGDATPSLYYQNDRNAAGYNPNDEHAIISTGAGGYVAYALRCDLATPKTPPPAVFVEYQADGRNRLQFYHVLLTNETWSTLSAPCLAGMILPGPRPLTDFPDPWLKEDKWDSDGGKPGLAYRDRKGQIWARAAGDLRIHMYYAMQEGFSFPALADKDQPVPGTAIPWLACLDGADPLTGEPEAWTWHIQWPENVPTMKIGQTLTTAADGLPEVWNARSMAVVYPDPGEAGKVVMLSDPTVIQSVPFDPGTFSTYGLSIDANGGLTLKGGKYHFTDLPPSLSSRLYADATNKKLCFMGERVEKNAGATILYPNVLSAAERRAVEGLARDNKATWASNVTDLATKPVVPNTNRVVRAEILTTYGAVDHYALTAMGGTNYVVVIENDATEETMALDPDGKPLACAVQAGDPINMHIFRVVPEYYAGRIVTREDEVNLLSQQLSVLYTDPIGGQADGFEFEWRHADPNADGTIPDDYGNTAVYKLRPVNTACGEVVGSTNTVGVGLTRFVVGQQGDTLANMVNTYWICRYRATEENTAARATMGEKWSAWCAPPALAEGWVQRVLNNVTPFNQRMTDLYNNKAETAVSMIQQAGAPFTGDVALNQDNLTSVGLIQLYETILNKAETLSIANIGGQATIGVAKQLQLAVERLADLYKVLGDEAYSDAKNPTIGFGEKIEFRDLVDYDCEASSLYCFDNQVNSLLDEELCLLRGRSGVSAPTTHMGPYYNRLLWNFTKGITAGEVAYAVNYGVSGTETVALSEEQAARLYPQGHGDAYGHYLSALKGWYRLLRNPNFAWFRPSQTEMNVADSAINVDYYEEAKFAEAAADLAKTAADVVDLSARKAWRDNGENGSGYLDTDANNAFGYGEWASRGGYGALVNWAVANSILPEDCTIEAARPESAPYQDAAYQDKGLTRIDRGTVDELKDICESAAAIMRAVDRIDSGLNPLGLSENAIPFDIAPGGVADGTETHYEQVRDRAKAALANARKVLDRAQTQACRLRLIAEGTENYADSIASEEENYENELIGYYGTPYSDDIGPGKTYKQGYAGPDLIHYMWMDLGQYGLSKIEDQTLPGLAFSGVTLAAKTAYDSIRRAVNDAIATTNGTLTMKFEVSRTGFIRKPDSITGYRASPGSIQEKYGALLLAYYDYTSSIVGYKKAYEKYKNVRDYTSAVLGLQTAFKVAEEGYNIAKLVMNYQLAELQIAENIYDFSDKLRMSSADVTVAAVPSVVGAGVSVVTSPRSLAEAAVAALNEVGGIFTLNSMLLAKNSAVVIKAEMAETETAIKMLESAFSYYKDYYSITEQFKDAALGLNSAYWDQVAAMQKLEVATDDLRKELGDAEAVLAKREAARKRQVSRLSQLRYNEMLFRRIRDKSLSRYSAAFDLAQKYVYMAAQVYDYETALKREEPGSGDAFKAKIVTTRALGAFDYYDDEPMVADDGDLGLSGYLAQMDANWQVMKPRLGINNPQPYTTWFSLRSECFRILGDATGDAAWAKELEKYRTDDLLSNAEFRRYCQPFQSKFGLKEKEPGLIIPFETTIDFALNLFGHDLAGGDHAYDSSWYSTRIAAAGVWFDGYNAKTETAASSARAQLADTPVVYLVPVGYDCLRAPGLADGTYWRFSVVDQVIPAPYNIGSYELDNESWMPSVNDADWQGVDSTVKIRRHPSFRAYFDAEGGEPSDDRLDATRLIGRSVWNTRWLLVIPAGAMNADREKALSVFLHGQDTNRDGKPDLRPVSDIRIGFRTYSQSGN